MRVCAEIGLSHDSSLGQAHALVDAVASTGADMLKAQCHAGDKCSEFRPGTFFPQDKTRAAYWKRTAFTREQWKGLANHAHAKNLSFGCSVFSLEGVELLSGIVDWWKIPSGCVENESLIKAVVSTRLPLVISSGMSTSTDALFAVSIARHYGCNATILQATSEYPCAPERIGLNVILELQKWGCEVGLSDHSGQIWPGIAAAVLGADMLEIHVVTSRHNFGPDVAASITVEELKQLVEGVRFIETAMSNPVDKDRMAQELSEMRRIFRNTGTQDSCKPLESSAGVS